MNILRRLPVIAGGAILVASVVVGMERTDAATISLPGTVYDFNDSHPDFEEFKYASETGIVESDLGPDKKPVYAQQTYTTSGQANFDQWYRDVEGVNVSAPYAITLSNTEVNPNIFTTSFPNDDFFPIDNQLLGNQGREHNYHFTYELNALFDYEGGETFTFTGDDDIWVFMNDKLAIDLGGVHQTQTSTVNLDQAASSLGITKGNKYDLDIFFAERHTTASNLKITTSLDLEPVPEPSSALSILVFGALGAGLWLKRKPKYQKSISCRY